MRFLLSDAASAARGRLAGADAEVSSACIDSRLAGPGSLFFALHGASADGHDFVDQVRTRGGFAVVSRVGWDSGVIEVDDVQRSMLGIASWIRDRIAAPVLALTGSAGKTTTREMTKSALSLKYRVGGTSGNLNNHLGLPLTLMNLDEDAEVVVLELGMNHEGELTSLGGVARPVISVVTNVGSAHLEYFGSRDAIAGAKSELIGQTLPGGTCLIPCGEPVLLEAAERRGLEILLVGPGGHYWLEGGDGSWRAMPWGIEFSPALPGAHNASNALFAAAAACRMGVDPDRALERLSEFGGLAGRGRRLRSGPMLVIDESYNSNPDSVTACLEVLASSPGRRAAVLGDMLELGDASPEMHRMVLGRAESLGLDLLLLVGPLFREAASGGLSTPYECVPDWESALEALVRGIREETTVLVKGSHAVQLDRLVGALPRED
jgi:UDP-N-acetylmuramoyl-tripeptide--D-alanyl-D-alanine ligase